MKLKNLSKEELESYGYDEISEMILAEKGTKMKIVDIFKKICELLELGEREFENKIADFFELVSTDKRFIVLEKGFCDLRKKHITNLVLEEDEEDDIIDEEEKVEDVEDINEEDDIFYDNSSDEDDVDDVDDDLDDFILVDEDETSA